MSDGLGVHVQYMSAYAWRAPCALCVCRCCWPRSQSSSYAQYTPAKCPYERQKLTVPGPHVWPCVCAARQGRPHGHTPTQARRASPVGSFLHQSTRNRPTPHPHVVRSVIRPGQYMCPRPSPAPLPDLCTSILCDDKTARTMRPLMLSSYANAVMT